jgi:hypothetical protein
MKDPNQLSNSEAIDTGFYYVKATPAPTAALVGTKTLSCNPCTADSWHAQSTTGDITNSGSSSLYADLEVNFASGQAVGNISLADDNQNTWTMTYYGEVKGAQLSSEFAYGTLDYNSVSYEAVGQVDGLFIGDSAQFGVLGGFGFNTTNITQSAEGVFYIPE